MSASGLREIVDAVAASLRDSPSIRPVRIYAGNFRPPAEQKKAAFSISLLNVVNTNIGGPGMVQLLDMVDWMGKGAVRREISNGSGWNLIEREDKGDGAFEGVMRAESDHSEATSETGEWESEPEQEIEEETKWKDVKMEQHLMISRANKEETEDNVKIIQKSY